MKVSKQLFWVVGLLSVLFAALPLACGQASVGTEVETTEAARSVEPFESPFASGSSIFKAPETVQELVNRSDLVLIGTVRSVSDTQSVVVGSSSDASALVTRGYPEPRVEETHYEISVGEVLLDDGAVSRLSGNASIALAGRHTAASPQVGERLLFALLSRPGDDLYSLVSNWSLIRLDGGAIKNFDGADPGYDGVTDESSLKNAVTTAAASHEKADPSEWPTLFD